VRYLFPKNIVIETSLPFRREFNYAVFECEKGIVLAHAYIPAREDFGAALTDYNLADKGFLAMVELNPQILGIGIATILTRACGFLMCHIG